MKRIMQKLPGALLAVTSFLLLTGYDACEPIIPNNGFDLWCGDQLCSWELEKGDVEKVPTWHSGDHGVKLVGDTAAISLLRDIDSTEVSCLRFELVAKIDVTADVVLQLDFYGDGSVDFERQIPTADWTELSYLVPLPPSYQGIRFRVQKSGPGEVILAQIYADDSQACAQAAPTTTSRPLGAWCEEPDQCGSGLCTRSIRAYQAERICGECHSDADCSGGQICGSVEPAGPHLELARACTDPGQKLLGERCGGDADCANGSCVDSICAGCESNADCASGAACETRANDGRPDELLFWLPPHQCGPAEGGALAGELCLIDADCASGACSQPATLSVCELDGRTCAGDDDCPDDLACRTIGSAGGTCQ